MRKIFRNIVTLVLICTLSTINVSGASDVLASEYLNSEYKIVPEEDLHKINNLFDERQTLSLNYNQNIKRINEIDLELHKLGVQTLSEQEVQAKFENAANVKDSKGITPYQDLPTGGTNVQWTSTRSIIVYNGKQYEVQEIRAVPTGAGSLSELKAIVATGQNLKAGSAYMVQAIVQDAAAMVIAAIPGTAFIGQGITLYTHLVNAYNTSIAHNTEFSNVEAVYAITLSTNEVCTFVKTPGSVDVGNQFLCYKGNRFDVYVQATTGELKADGQDNILIPTVKYTYGISEKSKYYDDKYNISCKYFVEHRDIPGYNTGWNYTGGRITIATINSTRTYTAQSIMPFGY